MASAGLPAVVLRGVVLNLDAQRLEELQILIADLEFSGHQRRLFAGLLTRLADPDRGFQHQKDIVSALFDSGNDIGNGLGISQRLIDRLAQFLHQLLQLLVHVTPLQDPTDALEFTPGRGETHPAAFNSLDAVTGHNASGQTPAPAILYPRSPSNETLLGKY